MTDPETSCKENCATKCNEPVTESACSLHEEEHESEGEFSEDVNESEYSSELELPPLEEHKSEDQCAKPTRFCHHEFEMGSGPECFELSTTFKQVGSNFKFQVTFETSSAQAGLSLVSRLYDN
jgi:hypothetical protein